jgi:hypothetical protein
MTDNFRIVITTRDSARWIERVLDWYRQNNLEPLFIVDARTKDTTRDLIEDYGFSFKEFLPRGDYPEAGLLEFGAQQSDTDWILRLDDDELPNLSLLDWVRKTGVKSKNQCWFISRRELFFNKNQILFSRSIGKYPLAEHPDKLHPVARLYHRKRISFLEEIHTTGLKDILLYDFAPDKNFIIHFNCLIHPFKYRLKKLEFFDSLNSKLSWSLADEYLPELFSSGFHQAKNIDQDEFSSFLNSLKPESDIIDLNARQKEFIISCVKDRAHEILRARYADSLTSGLSLKHFSADDVDWIGSIPRFLRKSLVKFMSTLISKRNKKYISVLWNYCDIYK